MKKKSQDILATALAIIGVIVLVVLAFGSIVICKNGVYTNYTDNDLLARGISTSDSFGQAFIDGHCMNTDSFYRLLPNETPTDKHIFIDGKEYIVYKTKLLWAVTYFVGDAEFIKNGGH